MSRLKMVKTAAGPNGSYRAGKFYSVSPEVFEQFTEGEDPAAISYEAAAELATEERGEKPERTWTAAPQPTEVDPPEPKARKRRAAKKR